MDYFNNSNWIYGDRFCAGYAIGSNVIVTCVTMAVFVTDFTVWCVCAGDVKYLTFNPIYEIH